jgi:predicted DCC family thiol-disulfide oxidoreductase YuxK
VDHPAPPNILFYDGLCGFCDRSVQYILKRDKRNQFRFSPLQGDLAKEALPKHGKNPEDLNTLYLLIDQGLPTERVLQKSDAAIQIGKILGGVSRISAFLTKLFPQPIRDWGYDFIAKIRYRIFGKRDSCRIPSANDRAKFIGL